jgi:RHS repeat-associated protein
MTHHRTRRRDATRCIASTSRWCSGSRSTCGARAIIHRQVWETTTDLVARTRTTVSPEGRVSRVTTDAQGRPVTVEAGGRSPVQTTYDSRGRVASVSTEAGAVTRSTDYNYSSSTGYLESIDDATGDTHAYSRDALGRVTQWTRPDGQVVSIDYDPDGNIIAITPPGKPAHEMAYTSLDAMSVYSPPEVASVDESTIYEYSPDGKLERVLLPDGRSIDNVYRADGKLASVVSPLGTAEYRYNETTGGLRGITSVDGGTLIFGSDGHLPTIEAWGGLEDGHVRGQVRRSYDSAFRVASLSVNGQLVVDYARDGDGLFTAAGEMEIARDPQSGDVSSTTLGAVTTVEQASAQGELASYYATAGTSVVYSEEILARDALGRITLRRDTTHGLATDWGYEYDDAGRLWRVTVAGSVVREYLYDHNGNRTSVVQGSGTESCTYDAQDRILGCGDVVYEHNAVGQLSSKTDTGSSATTTYDYDVFGNLRSVELPDGSSLEYEIDAQNRRIGKKVNGVRQWGLLYQTQLAPIAMLDASNQVVATFVYVTRSHSPEYMLRGGETYRFVHDHLGSVRMVVIASTGVVAQELEYDEWGRVVADSNPGWQPFGFAGGLYDADTGLVRFGARDYDADSGRWVTRDPILFDGGQANLFLYVNGDSVNRSDPSGLDEYGPGANECGYYEGRCYDNGGSYYCDSTPVFGGAAWWCGFFGSGKPGDSLWVDWSRCTRECLQRCDLDTVAGQGPADPNATDMCRAQEEPNNSWPLTDRGNFGCHFGCYLFCAAFSVGQQGALY